MRPITSKPTDLIEKKIIATMLPHLGMRFTDLHREYEKRCPELRSSSDGSSAPVDASCDTISKWWSRGVKTRRIMTLLSIINHSLVIVPAGAKVTVETSRSKAVTQCVPNDKLLLIAADDTGMNLTSAILDAPEQQLRRKRTAKQEGK